MEENLKMQLVHSFFQFKKLMSSGFILDSADEKSAINMTELFLMHEIASNSPNCGNIICLSNVRDYLSVSKAAVSQMLGSLEKKGYINREPDKKNRRNLIVTLTPEGRAVLKKRHDDFNSRLDLILNRLGEEDASHLIRISGCMTEIVQKINNESKKET